MRKPPAPPSISNLALGGVAALFAVTLTILAALFYDLRLRKPVVLARQESAISPLPAAVSKPSVERRESAPTLNSIEPEDMSVIRIALRPETALPPQPERAAEPAPTLERTPDVAQSSPASSIPMASPVSSPGALPDRGNNEMVPEIKGLSYSAKKALSNGGDATPNPGKKAEPKKLIPPLPPKAVVKSETAKAAPPVAPPPKPTLPPLDTAKIDLSRAPVYVLNDGRRIRALAVRDMGTTLTVKNEAGKDITFKKSEIKEIVRG